MRMYLWTREHADWFTTVAIELRRGGSTSVILLVKENGTWFTRSFDTSWDQNSWTSLDIEDAS